MRIFSTRSKRLLALCGVAVGTLCAAYWIWSAAATGRQKAAALFEELVVSRGAQNPSSILQDMADRVASDIPGAKQVIDKLGHERRDTADILRDIESLGPEAMPLFRGELDSADRERRWCAAMACTRVADQRSVVSMAYLLEDGDDMMRCLAINALARVGGPASMEILARKLDDVTYNRVFKVDFSTRDEMLRGAEPVKVNAWSFIAYCLGKSARSEAIPALEKAAKSSDDQLSRTASWAITRIGNSRDTVGAGTTRHGVEDERSVP